MGVRDSPGRMAEGASGRNWALTSACRPARSARSSAEIDATLKARWPRTASGVFRPRGRRQPSRVGAHGRTLDPGVDIERGRSMASRPRRRGFDLGGTRHRLAEEGIPAPVAQPRGDRPDAHDQASHGSRTASSIRARSSDRGIGTGRAPAAPAFAAPKKNAANPRRFCSGAWPEKSHEVTYFETDFLNMRSIFSLVASTPD